MKRELTNDTRRFRAKDAKDAKKKRLCELSVLGAKRSSARWCQHDFARFFRIVVFTLRVKFWAALFRSRLPSV